MNGAGRIKIECLREQQYKEEHVRAAIESKIVVELNEIINVGKIWEQVKQAVVDGAKECSTVKVKKTNPKSEGWGQ